MVYTCSLCESMLHMVIQTYLAYDTVQMWFNIIPLLISPVDNLKDSMLRSQVHELCFKGTFKFTVLLYVATSP